MIDKANILTGEDLSWNQCAIELGDWSLTRLDELLRQETAHGLNASTRANLWVNRLKGTPFQFESLLPDVHNHVRVRLATFDCITFVYHVIALAIATSALDYARRLRRLRYVGEGDVSNDPIAGNLIDFACEALLFQAIDEGLLTDVTASVCGSTESIEMVLGPVVRPREHDHRETTVYPRFPGRTLSARIAPSQASETFNESSLRDGDVIVFTKGHGFPTFVRHAGFVQHHDGKALLVHATKNFYVSEDPLPLPSLPPDEKKFLPGVVITGSYLGDDQAVEFEGKRYYGYDMDRPRSMTDYAKNFAGFSVLRIP